MYSLDFCLNHLTDSNVELTIADYMLLIYDVAYLNHLGVSLQLLFRTFEP
jgi:hypothetical protein